MVVGIIAYYLAELLMPVTTNAAVFFPVLGALLLGTAGLEVANQMVCTSVDWMAVLLWVGQMTLLAIVVALIITEGGLGMLSRMWRAQWEQAAAEKAREEARAEAREIDRQWREWVRDYGDWNRRADAAEADGKLFREPPPPQPRM